MPPAPQQQTHKNTSAPLAWGPRAALAVSLVAYIASQLILVIPAVLIAAFNRGANIETILSGSAWIQLVLTGISSIGLVATLWLFLRSRNQSFKALGFARIKASDFGWLAIALVAYLIFLTITMSAASHIPGFNPDQSQNIGFSSAAGWQMLFAFIGLVVLPPIAEEMLFRGFLYRGLASRWPRVISALLTSFLFGLVHFQWNVSLDVFILSLVLIALYEKTHNLWMSVFLHAIKNGLAFMALFVFISN